MRLIGKLDSPYVRRVAISLHLLDIPFTHDNLSVFRDYEAFAVLNPIVKAPTLITDAGVALLDSTLILEVLAQSVAPDRRLSPSDAAAFIHHQRIVGLALAACEKTVQIVYERQLRPDDKQHAPWIARVDAQLTAAYALLEREVVREGPWLFGTRVLQADITAAVAWRFTQDILVGHVDPKQHPHLARLSADAETLDAFRAAAPD